MSASYDLIVCPVVTLASESDEPINPLSDCNWFIGRISALFNHDRAVSGITRLDKRASNAEIRAFKQGHV